MHIKNDKLSKNSSNFQYKKATTSFSKDNNKLNLVKERLKELIDEYFKGLDEYEVVD